MGGELPQPPGGLLAGFAAGSLVAGYRLEEQVGAGGMAVVFRAIDQRLGRPVALKILAPALASDQAFRHRFIRESRAAAAVDDPHIIPIHEAGEADGVLFIAMRYVPGRDVRNLLHREGPLAPDRVAGIVSAVGSALDAAHEAGLVHRDVKPANMLVDVRPGRPDHVYLSDFGISKRAASSVGLTRAGQYVGTPDYIAPEQIDGRPVDGRTDQYALACAAFELLTGQPPFPRDDPTAVIWAHLSAPPPPLSSMRPSVPAAADQVFARALAKAPSDRYARCLDFAEALRGALGLAQYHFASPSTPEAAATDHPATRIEQDRNAAPTVTSVPGPVPPGTDHGDADPLAPLGTIEADPGTAPAAPGDLAGPDAEGSDSPGIAGMADMADTAAFQGTACADDASTEPGPPAEASQDPGGAGPSGAGPSAPADRRGTARRSRRRRVALGSASAVTALAVVAGLVIWHALAVTVPPVLTPGGTGVRQTTFTTAQIYWSRPATGPQPRRYLIFRDGAEIGSVPGRTTQYEVTGLTPGTEHIYQIMAVRSHQRSQMSRAIFVRALVTPPISGAVLTGRFTVEYENAEWYDASEQKLDHDSWSFSPSCATGPCSVQLRGEFQGSPLTSTLHRHGQAYTGTAFNTKFFYCNVNGDSSNYFTIRLTLRGASASGHNWQATSFTGTINVYSPAVANCDSSTVTAVIKGSTG